jgi:hypothetical protein
MEELAKQFAEMTAHLGDVVKEIRERDHCPIQKFATTSDKKKGTCYSCGEEGHYSYECMSETKHKAQPSNATTRNKEQANIITFKEIGDSDEEWEVYPAQTTKKDVHKEPYRRPPERPKKNPVEKQMETTTESQAEEMDQDIELEQTVQDII